ELAFLNLHENGSRFSTATAELLRVLIREAARFAHGPQRLAALSAKVAPLAILSLAPRTLHVRVSQKGRSSGTGRTRCHPASHHSDAVHRGRWLVRQPPEPRPSSSDSWKAAPRSANVELPGVRPRIATCFSKAMFCATMTYSPL